MESFKFVGAKFRGLIVRFFFYSWGYNSWMGRFLVSRKKSNSFKICFRRGYKFVGEGSHEFHQNWATTNYNNSTVCYDWQKNVSFSHSFCCNVKSCNVKCFVRDIITSMPLHKLLQRICAGNDRLWTPILSMALKTVLTTLMWVY